MPELPKDYIDCSYEVPRWPGLLLGFVSLVIIVVIFLFGPKLVGLF